MYLTYRTIGSKNRKLNQLLIQLMNKRTLLVLLFALIAIMGMAQTKTATITAKSSTLKPSKFVTVSINGQRFTATVTDGQFTVTVPVKDGITVAHYSILEVGDHNWMAPIFLAPGVNVKITDTKGDYYALWKVQSPVAAQKTYNRLIAHSYDALKEMYQHKSRTSEYLKAESKWMKQQMDLLPSLPVDAGSTEAVRILSLIADNRKDFPYLEQLRKLEERVNLKEDQRVLGPIKITKIGDKFTGMEIEDKITDTDLVDIQGEKHHLSELVGKNGKYVLLNFWQIGCYPCILSEPEWKAAYEKAKDKIEFVNINIDDIEKWKNEEKPNDIIGYNWNDGKKGKGLLRRYNEGASTPFYVLISPNGTVQWKQVGYIPGSILGIAEGKLGPQQDNFNPPMLAIRKVTANTNGTIINFRFILHKRGAFSCTKDACLEANGKKYMLTNAEGIKLRQKNVPTELAIPSAPNHKDIIYYSDFTLTFEPFDTIPDTFDFRCGSEDMRNPLIIRNIHTK